MLPLGMLRKIVLLAGCVWLNGLWLPAQSARPHVTGLPTMKVYRSEHFEIRARNVSPLVLERLAAAGDDFLDRLERRWAVSLGEDKVVVSIGAKTGADPWNAVFDLPTWITSGYSVQTRQVVIQIRDRLEFDFEPLERSLRIQSVRFLLNRNRDNTLPPFLEEGLALSSSRRWTTRESYRAILAFRRVGPIDGWNVIAPEDVRRGFDADRQVLSALMVRWMWRENRDGMHHFLAHFLAGDPWRRALDRAGFGEFDALMERFLRDQKPKYQWFHAALTFDFWMILVGLAFLGLAMGWILRAVRRVRSGQHLRPEVADTPSLDQDLLDELSRSPAFGGGTASPQGAPEQTRPPPKRRPASRRPTEDLKAQQEIDVDVDRFFSATREPSPPPNKPGRRTVPLPPMPEPPTPPKKKEGEPSGGGKKAVFDRSDDLERDVDSFFDQFANAPERREKNKGPAGKE